jgi:hypothetical protein
MRMMKTIAASLVLLCGTTAFGAVKGDYVEVRTAAVYAGACHYNGELVTTGREAIMAWNVAGGAFDGVDLAGVRAIAVVNCDANLIESAARRSEIVVDGTDAQVVAFAAMLKQQSAATFGDVLSVKRGPVTFKHDAKDGYTVDAAGFASARVKPMADEACCKQPSDVCYEPLTQLQARKVGFTGAASYAGGKAGQQWQRAGENSAFYGSFTR